MYILEKGKIYLDQKNICILPKIINPNSFIWQKSGIFGDQNSEFELKCI